MSNNKFDIYETVTNKIIDFIKTQDEPMMPWHQDCATLIPLNIESKKAYAGVNILSLWVTAQTQGFKCPEWGTFRQWSERGLKVIKGAKGTPIVYYNSIKIENKNSITEGEADSVEKFMPFAKFSFVFNREQTENYLACDPEFKALKKDKRAIFIASSSSSASAATDYLFSLNGDCKKNKNTNSNNISIMLKDKKLFCKKMNNKKPKLKH